MNRPRAALICVLGIAFVAVDAGISTAAPAPPKPTVVKGSGDLTAAVERYRQLLGPDNGGDPGAQPSGRREINWDGVPDEFAEPNGYPPDFFNAPVAPRGTRCGPVDAG